MIRLSIVVNGSYSARMLITSGILQVTAGLYQLPGAGNRVHSCKVYRRDQGSGSKMFEVELPFRGTYLEWRNELIGTLSISMRKKGKVVHVGRKSPWQGYRLGTDRLVGAALW